MIHKPVLTNEVLKYLNPKPNQNFIDATFGLGGHDGFILEKNKPKGRILGIEADIELCQMMQNRMKEFPIFNSQFPNRLTLVNDSYINLEKIVKKYNFQPIQGVLFDLGMSSWHLEKSGRGFSFQKNEPLDMRYNPITRYERSLKYCYQLTAAEIVNQWSEKEIERILRDYGEERFAKRIAKVIVEHRKKEPIETTFQLVEVIKKAMPGKFQRGRLRPVKSRKAGSPSAKFHRVNPATKTFQALRIAVNQELENLKKVLPQAIDLLETGGRVVVISFHSLEDRIVKQFFKTQSQKGLLSILTKKPITASAAEIKQNPRARSAKLRAAVKI